MLLGRNDYTMKTYKALMDAVNEALKTLNGDETDDAAAGPSGAGDASGSAAQPSSPAAAAASGSPTGGVSARKGTAHGRWTAEELEMAAWSRAVLPQLATDEQLGPAKKRAKR